MPPFRPRKKRISVLTDKQHMPTISRHFILLFAWTLHIMIGSGVSASSSSPRRMPIETHKRNTKTEKLGDELAKRVQHLFDQANDLPLTIQRKKEGITVRTAWQGNTVVTLSECVHTPYPPSAFLPFLTQFNRAFPVVNKMTAWVETLTRDGSQEREGVKSQVNMPFPLQNRLVVHWKYLKLNWDNQPDEHLLIISEQDNHDLLKRYVTVTERKKFVLGRTHLCAFWIRPVRDESNQVIGSTVRYAFSGDAGGSVPKFVQDLMGPKSALDSVTGLLSFVEQQQQQQQQQGGRLSKS